MLRILEIQKLLSKSLNNFHLISESTSSKLIYSSYLLTIFLWFLYFCIYGHSKNNSRKVEFIIGFNWNIKFDSWLTSIDFNSTQNKHFPSSSLLTAKHHSRSPKYLLLQSQEYHFNLVLFTLENVLPPRTFRKHLEKIQKSLIEILFWYFFITKPL